jgi:hypothetical protein
VCCVAPNGASANGAKPNIIYPTNLKCAQAYLASLVP